MMTTINLLGPNLSAKNQSKGNLHAHRADCGDIQKGYSPYERDGGWVLDVGSRLELAQEAYPPGSFDWDGSLEESESYVGDIWFAPCLKDLPMEAEPDLGNVQESDRPYARKDV